MIAYGRLLQPGFARPSSPTAFFSLHLELMSAAWAKWPDVWSLRLSLFSQLLSLVWLLWCLISMLGWQLNASHLGDARTQDL